MSRRSEQLALLALGGGLLAAGHKLMDAELGALGLSHAVGVALVAAAMRG